MKEEFSFVPFEVSPLPAGPWIVFAPHADDETFGMGGALLRASDEGIETHVVVLTDGALGGDRDDLVALRKAELSSAAALLKLKSVQCWDQPDRGLRVTDGLKAKVAAYIREIAPESVFFPGAYEPHPDHRSTTQLIWQTLMELKLAEFEVPGAYAYEIGVQSPINRMIDVTSVVNRKKEVMAQYCSQNEENDYPDLVLALNRARTFSLPTEVTYAEAFFAFPSDSLEFALDKVTQDYFDMYWES